jgi:hypothetical protein
MISILEHLNPMNTRTSCFSKSNLIFFSNVVLVVHSCLVALRIFDWNFRSVHHCLWPARHIRPILRLPQEMHKFSKNLGAIWNSESENGDLKQFPCCGPTNIRGHHTKYSCPDDQAPGICAPLVYALYYIIIKRTGISVAIACELLDLPTTW